MNIGRRSIPLLLATCFVVFAGHAAPARASSPTIHFWIDGWSADEIQRADGDRGSWCTMLLIIVPAAAAGTWRMPNGELTLKQRYQAISGILETDGKAIPITNGRLRGDRISFAAGGMTYAGRGSGDSTGGDNDAWNARRAPREAVTR